MMTLLITLVCILVVQAIIASACGLYLLVTYTAKKRLLDQHNARFVPITSPSDLHAFDGVQSPLPPHWQTEPYDA